MRELRVEHGHHMTPRSKGPGFNSYFSGQLTDQVGRNKIAELTKDGKVGAGWFVCFFIFHTCRVAGKKRADQPFVLSSYGMTVTEWH